MRIWNFILAIFLISTGVSCTGQTNGEDIENFVQRFKTIIDGDDPDQFLQELVLSKSEYRAFLKKEWKKKGRRKGLDKSTEKAWKLISRGDGTWVSNGIITPQRKFEPLMTNVDYYDIKIEQSQEAKKVFGEVAFADITVITAKFKLSGYPNIEELISFPCILTKDGKWKMTYSLNLRVLK